MVQTRNNYDLGVMNGAMGIVTHVGRDGSLVVEFDLPAPRRRRPAKREGRLAARQAGGMPVEVEAGSPNLQDLQLAYALTIHKAQGSEFPCAIVVVHKAHAFMHHRNLFYTGVTRAKETAVVIGDRWGITNCARKRHFDERKTFLSLLLADLPDVPHAGRR